MTAAVGEANCHRAVFTSGTCLFRSVEGNNDVSSLCSCWIANEGSLEDLKTS